LGDRRGSFLFQFTGSAIKNPLTDKGGMEPRHARVRLRTQSVSDIEALVASGEPLLKFTRQVWACKSRHIRDISNAHSRGVVQTQWACALLLNLSAWNKKCTVVFY
jgi:hypothetical protein